MCPDRTRILHNLPGRAQLPHRHFPTLQRERRGREHVLAGAFPLFIAPMMHNIGVDWGSTIFAVISVLLIPIPYVFFVYGKRIRANGYWSKESV